MTNYVALLRAVNVGGTGKLPMAELRAIAEGLGWQQVRTYIASGNLLFASEHDAAHCQAQLEQALLDHAGKPVGVLIRSAEQMAQVLAANPFPEAPGNRVVAIFLDSAPPTHWQEGVRGQQAEMIAPGDRELYVHYGDGMADSRLRIAAAESGTARNMNTVAKLVSMLA